MATTCALALCSSAKDGAQNSTAVACQHCTVFMHHHRFAGHDCLQQLVSSFFDPHTCRTVLTKRGARAPSFSCESRSLLDIMAGSSQDTPAVTAVEETDYTPNYRNIPPEVEALWASLRKLREIPGTEGDVEVKKSVPLPGVFSKISDDITFLWFQRYQEQNFCATFDIGNLLCWMNGMPFLASTPSLPFGIARPEPQSDLASIPPSPVDPAAAAAVQLSRRRRPSLQQETAGQCTSPQWTF